MKVLLVGIRDWSYVGYTFSLCLRSVGIEADMLVNQPYDYRPGCGIPFNNIAQVKKYAEKADIIQFMQGQWVDTGVDLSKKRVFVFYGGSNYRFDPVGVSSVFNPIVEKSMVQSGDLFGLGCKNEVWIQPAVDLDMLRPVYDRHSDKIVVAHFPSSNAKGTDNINLAVKQALSDCGNRLEFITSTKKVGWMEHLARVSKCDVYIEQVALTQKFKGKTLKIGNCGVSAFEAAAMGKIVIANFLSSDQYKKEYGPHAVCVANSSSEIVDRLTEISMLSDDELLERKKASRNWVEQFHSFQAVGTRLKEKVYEI